MKTKLSFVITFLFVWASLGIACAEPTKIKIKIVNSELERNRLLWQESKIVYYNFVSYRLQGGEYGWVPVLIQVRNGKAISMELAGERGQLDSIDGYEDFDTVDKIFNQIQEAYDKEYRVEVVYNKKYGYPEKTNIASMKGVHTAFTIEISKFEIIKTN